MSILDGLFGSYNPFLLSAPRLQQPRDQLMGFGAQSRTGIAWAAEQQRAEFFRMYAQPAMIVSTDGSLEPPAPIRRGHNCCGCGAPRRTGTDCDYCGRP